MTSDMVARPYQDECFTAVEMAWNAGVSRQLLVLATGAGKSFIGSRIPGRLGLQGKTLWCVHRRELVEQAADHLQRANPTASIGIEMASSHAQPDCDIVVASFPTIGRTNSKRIKKFNPDEFGCVICDESHHLQASNKTYTNVLDYFGVGADSSNRSKLFVGLTATPKRSSGEGLQEFFDKIVYQKHIRELIEEKFLAPITAYVIHSETDLSGVHTSYGDFVQTELSAAVNSAERNELIVKSYKAKADGRTALVFCASVDHAEAVAEKFNESDIEARTVFGKTDKDERKETLRWFRNTPGAVLCNFSVLGEGADIPSCNCVIIGRPTQSNLVMTQMVGRGTRLSPETGKTDLLVLDVADASSKASIVTTATLFSLPDQLDCEGRDVLTVADEFAQIKEENPALDFGDCYTIEEVRKRLQHADLFAQANNEVTDMSDFAWSETDNGNEYVLNLPDGDTGGYMSIKKNLLGEWELCFFQRHDWRQGRKRVVHALAVTKELSESVTTAEEFIRKNHSETTILVDKNARWRKHGASDKQLALLKKLGARDEGIATFLSKYPTPTKGQASTVLDAYFARRRR